ncbi:MAG: hypothetical protein Q7R76_06725 [Candidatus Woesearchaeota archaeon]|nr:hypothetical protein [Candidatus Woesearchaeota archaeon]
MAKKQKQHENTYEKYEEQNKEKLAKMPHIESKIFKSKSGDYVVHRTVITDIRPTSYYEKVMEGDAGDDDEEKGRDRHGFRLFKL